jgi:hypothetical protein
MVVVARKARILGSSMMWATMNNKQQIHYTYAVPRCRFVASAARQLPPLSWQATLAGLVTPLGRYPLYTLYIALKHFWKHFKKRRDF